MSIKYSKRISQSDFEDIVIQESEETESLKLLIINLNRKFRKGLLDMDKSVDDIRIHHSNVLNVLNQDLVSYTDGGKFSMWDIAQNVYFLSTANCSQYMKDVIQQWTEEQQRRDE